MHFTLLHRLIPGIAHCLHYNVHGTICRVSSRSSRHFYRVESEASGREMNYWTGKRSFLRGFISVTFLRHSSMCIRARAIHDFIVCASRIPFPFRSSCYVNGLESGNWLNLICCCPAYTNLDSDSLHSDSELVLHPQPVATVRLAWHSDAARSSICVAGSLFLGHSLLQRLLVLFDYCNPSFPSEAALASWSQFLILHTTLPALRIVPKISTYASELQLQLLNLCLQPSALVFKAPHGC